MDTAYHIPGPPGQRTRINHAKGTHSRTSKSCNRSDIIGALIRDINTEKLNIKLLLKNEYRVNDNVGNVGDYTNDITINVIC